MPAGGAVVSISSAGGLGWARRREEIKELLETADFDDGLLLDGHTLYVVQNRLNQIAVVHLDADGTSGTVCRVITAPPGLFKAARRGSLTLASKLTATLGTTSLLLPQPKQVSRSIAAISHLRFI